MPGVTVAFRGVRFGYGASPILDGVDLDLSAGEFVVLTGANGSGKSTILRLALGLLRPHAGTVRVFGLEADAPAARRRVGYAPQGLRMATSLPVSVAEVVTAGLTGRRGALHRPDAADRSAVAEAIASVGLAGLERECLFELSGGQQQRAILARAMVARPELLLLDEPTTGIDQQLRPAIAADLRARADAGATVVAVSHDPDDFHATCDRIIVVRDGGVRHITHEEFHAHLELGP